MHEAQKYPDATEWAAAHNAELDKLDEIKAIEWMPAHLLTKDMKLVQLTMAYKYKRMDNGTITKKKAHFSLRGDRMLSNVHFDP